MVAARGSLRLALEWNCSDDHLVVHGGQGSADEGANPEDPLRNETRFRCEIFRVLIFFTKFQGIDRLSTTKDIDVPSYTPIV